MIKLAEPQIQTEIYDRINELLSQKSQNYPDNALDLRELPRASLNQQISLPGNPSIKNKSVNNRD